MTHEDTELGVMRAIQEHMRAHTSAPTIDELVRRVGDEDAREVAAVLRRLSARGLVEVGGRRRSARLTYRGYSLVVGGAPGSAPDHALSREI